MPETTLLSLLHAGRVCEPFGSVLGLYPELHPARVLGAQKRALLVHWDLVQVHWHLLGAILHVLCGWRRAQPLCSEGEAPSGGSFGHFLFPNFSLLSSPSPPGVDSPLLPVSLLMGMVCANPCETSGPSSTLRSKHLNSRTPSLQPKGNSLAVLFFFLSFFSSVSNTGC